MEGYVSVNEAAHRLGRSIEQVRRYLREGQLPGRRIGGQWFIEEDALTGWRPERRPPGAGQVSEAVVAYEARTMKTKETKKSDHQRRKEWIDELKEIHERFREESGELNLDPVELLRRSREEH